MAIDGYGNMTLGDATRTLWFLWLGGDYHLIPPGELAQALALEQAAHIVVKMIDDWRASPQNDPGSSATLIRAKGRGNVPERGEEASSAGTLR